MVCKNLVPKVCIEGKHVISRVMAVVGLCGVGKSVVTQILSSALESEVVYFGGVITNEVARRGLSLTLENERDVREDIRRIHGMSAVAVLAAPTVQAHLDCGRSVVIDGLYSYAEKDYLVQNLTAPLKLIAVHSPKHLRYERMAVRKHRPLTPEQVDQRDLSEVAALDKATPIALADSHVVNDGTIDELRRSLERALRIS